MANPPRIKRGNQLRLLNTSRIGTAENASISIVLGNCASEISKALMTVFINVFSNLDIIGKTYKSMKQINIIGTPKIPIAICA